MNTLYLLFEIKFVTMRFVFIAVVFSSIVGADEAGNSDIGILIFITIYYIFLYCFQ